MLKHRKQEESGIGLEAQDLGGYNPPFRTCLFWNMGLIPLNFYLHVLRDSCLEGKDA